MKINKKILILFIFACLATQIGKGSTDGLIKYKPSMPKDVYSVILPHTTFDGINPLAKTSKNIKESFEKPEPGFELDHIIDNDAQTNALQDVAGNEFNPNVPGGGFYKSKDNQERYIKEYLKNFKQILKCSYQHDIVISLETEFSLKNFKINSDEEISEQIAQFHQELKKFKDQHHVIHSQVGNRSIKTITILNNNYSEWTYDNTATLEQMLQDLNGADQTDTLPRVITISNNLLKNLLNNIMDDLEKKLPNPFVPFFSKVLVCDSNSLTLFHYAVNKYSSTEKIALLLDTTILGANYSSVRPYKIFGGSRDIALLFLRNRPFFVKQDDMKSLSLDLHSLFSGYDPKLIIEIFGLGKENRFIKTDHRSTLVTREAYSLDNPHLLNSLVNIGINIFHQYTNFEMYPGKESRATLFQYYVCCRGQREITKYFLKNPDLFLKGICGVDNQNNTALHYACTYQAASYHYNFESKKDIVAQILKEKGDVNAQNSNGDTPLHLALEMYLESYSHQNISIEIIQLLVQHGVNIDIKNNKNESPKDYVTRYDLKAIIEIFDQQKQLMKDNQQQKRTVIRNGIAFGIVGTLSAAFLVKKFVLPRFYKSQAA